MMNKRMMNKKMEIKDIVMVAFMAAVMAVLSPISLPIGPVPISLATFAVCLSATVLGIFQLWRRSREALRSYGRVSYRNDFLELSGRFRIGTLFQRASSTICFFSFGNAVLLYSWNLMACKTPVFLLFQGIGCRSDSFYYSGLY